MDLARLCILAELLSRKKIQRYEGNDQKLIETMLIEMLIERIQKACQRSREAIDDATGIASRDLVAGPPRGRRRSTLTSNYSTEMNSKARERGTSSIFHKCAAKRERTCRTFVQECEPL
jgi:hypothetical protein